MKNLTFRQLRVFEAAARHESFARAAEQLSLTPPAVSLQIKELEENIGLPLFDRQRRRVSLTTIGEYFLVYARRLLDTLQEADDAMSRFVGLQSGVVNVGLVSTAVHFMPSLLRQFEREHPGIEVKLLVARNREQMHELLGSNAIDVAVMGRPPRELQTHSEVIAPHPFVFVSSPTHPLLQIGHPPLSALEPYPLLLREAGSATRDAFEALVADQVFSPVRTMEIASNELIKQAVIADLGIAFLSLHSLGHAMTSGQLLLLHVPATPVIRSWNLVHLQSRTLSPAAERFRYFMLETAMPALAALDERALNG
jgi:DNA-binding transcriptional LysR family regulator